MGKVEHLGTRDGRVRGPEEAPGLRFAVIVARQNEPAIESGRFCLWFLHSVRTLKRELYLRGAFGSNVATTFTKGTLPTTVFGSSNASNSTSQPSEAISLEIN